MSQAHAESPDISRPAEPLAKKRIESLDAFRGFTIFLMVFVIAVAAGGYQWAPGSMPQQARWFGSLPISTWFHADVAFEMWEVRAQKHFAEQGLTPEEVEAAVAGRPEHNLRNIGVTITDLVAPWFVFIVGACVPLSRVGKDPKWLSVASRRAALLILAGMIYISLVIKQTSWWWGVLQAIGVAYFMAVAMWHLPKKLHWPAVLGVGLLNLALTELAPQWTEGWEGMHDGAFGTLSNPQGNWFRPWIVHCLPWLSISYGTMAMIGVLLGHALITREKREITKQALLVGVTFTLLGWIIHRIGFATDNYSLAFNKPAVTTSYAFFTAGLGALAYLVFYYIIDVAGIRFWARPLNVFGVNPLVAYFMMIVMRRALESLGLIDFFHRYQNAGLYGATDGVNPVIERWAVMFGDPGAPSKAVLWFLDKSLYTGVMWGLIWTFLLWLIMLYLNRKNFFWKL